MSLRQLTCQFVGQPGQQIFVVAHHPAAFSGSCVMVCPPFAEEMNKSRKMFTELAKKLCDQGIALVVPDLYGTGDSEGDFSDATWDRWLKDMAATEAWVNSKGWHVEALLGVRLGALLAVQHAAQRQAPLSSTVFWQPFLDGARAFDQFLRLRVMASMMKDKKETVADLKSRFAAHEVVEVAGYRIAPQLAQELATLRFVADANNNLGALHWFEVLLSPDASVPLPVTKAVEAAGQQLQISLQTVVGPTFWGSTEIVCIENLLKETATAFGCSVPHG